MSRYRLGPDAHLALWDAINAYATGCGGMPEICIGRVSRMTAVAEVERIISDALASSATAQSAAETRELKALAEVDELRAALREMRALAVRYDTFASAKDWLGANMITVEMNELARLAGEL